jgi:hypothetical protein
MGEDMKPGEGSVDAVALENARMGYEVAVTLWTYQGDLNWNRFNAMLTSNGVIVSVIGYLLASGNELTLFAVALPIVGLVVCALWALFAARGFVYHRYWGSRARELEEAYLGPAVRTVSKARSLRKGGEVEFKGLSKLGGQKEVTYAVILIYALVFVAALAYTICALVQ